MTPSPTNLLPKIFCCRQISRRRFPLKEKGGRCRMVRKAGTMGGHRLPTNRWAPAFGQEAADHLICSYFATCHWCWKHSNKVLRVACQAHTFLDLPFFHFWLFVLGDLPSQCAHCCTAHLVFAHNSGFPNCWLKWLLCGCFMFQLIAHSSFTTVVSEIRLVGIEHWSWCYREDLFRTALTPITTYCQSCQNSFLCALLLTNQHPNPTQCQQNIWDSKGERVCGTGLVPCCNYPTASSFILNLIENRLWANKI